MVKYRKLKLIIPLLIIAVVGVAIGVYLTFIKDNRQPSSNESINTPVTPSITWTKYSNSNLNIQLEYPSNWIIGDDSGAVSIKSNTDDKSRLTLQARDGTFDNELKLWKSRLLVEGRTEDEITVDGIKGIKLKGIFGNPGNANEVQQAILILPFNNKVYVVINSRPLNTELEDEVFKKVVSSLDFDNSVLWKTYESPTYGYSFEYNNDWHFTDITSTVKGGRAVNDHILSYVVFGITDPLTSSKNLATVSVMNSTVTRELEKLQSRYQTSGQTVTTTAIDNIAATKLVANPEAGRSGAVYFMQYNDRTYIIAAAREGLVNAEDDDFLRIVKTWKFNR